MRIILTRQPAQAGHIEAGLEHSGYSIAFLPLTDFQLPEDTGALDAMITGLHAGRWDRLLLTSPNTIRALVARSWDPVATEAHTVIGVTGPGTARVLHDSGATMTPWMPNNDASAAGILAQFPTGPGTVALPQGAAAGDAMCTGLTQRGWEVTHAVAYHTVDYPAQPDRALLPVEQGSLETADVHSDDVIVLTAPSAARRWAEVAVPVRAVIAIGHPTQRAADESNIALAATAPSPNATGLAAVLEALD
ncbi:hypothetical protein GCM10009720_02670 [Yaniella flava]|uniref:Uroporphyrinogen-III synthase n=1 Tax=Yaniella flava TaxID=287930 RepID=A0ABN2U2I3_9MICC|nr:uroporphyrinogen-III synthase [Micrococcaceae bacterium]